MARVTLQLSEIQQKQKLLVDVTKGHEGSELGVAMLFEGVYQLTLQGAKEGAIRDFLEKAIQQYRRRKIAEPTKRQIDLVSLPRKH